MLMACFSTYSISCYLLMVCQKGKAVGQRFLNHFRPPSLSIIIELQSTTLCPFEQICTIFISLTHSFMYNIGQDVGAAVLLPPQQTLGTLYVDFCKSLISIDLLGSRLAMLHCP